MGPTSPRSKDAEIRAALGSAALLFVNHVRVNVMGIPKIPALRRGYCAEPERCPLAVSLGRGANVDTTEVHVTTLMAEDRRTLTLPLAVQEFVRRLDRGDYPGLTLTHE